MKALPKVLLALTAVAALSVVYPASVQAVPTTYQYTGNQFTFAAGAYTTSDFVSGMLTLAGPLAPNMLETNITPIAFTFSDGVQTITELTPNISFLDFVVGTGLTGAITSWDMIMVLGSGATIRTANRPPSVVDGGRLDIAQFGEIRDRPGVWTTVEGVPDTGPTLSLIMLTLVALGLAARQFKRPPA